MSFRTALRASRPLTTSLTAPTASRAGAIAFRRGLNESSPVKKDDDNGQYSPGYEKHVQQVDPKFAGVDESVTFKHPTVCLLHCAVSALVNDGVLPGRVLGR